MNLLYKSFILDVTHTRNVKKLFIRLVDDYIKDYSISNCELYK